MLGLLIALALALPFLAVGMARFEFPKFEDQSYPNFIADTFDKRTLVQGGILLDPSTFSENSNGYKNADAGILVGRTATERDNNAAFGKIDDVNKPIGNQAEVFLLAHDVQYLRENPAAAVLREGTQIRMDQLPNYSDFTTAESDFVKNTFEVVPGTA